MLKLESISKSYGRKTVLSNIDHEFESGLNLLVGPSGAGKSTLLRLCATAEQPTSGKLFWSGKRFNRTRRTLRGQLGYAPQILDLPLDITGMEFLLHIAAIKGVSRDAKKQATQILSQLGLESDANQRLIGWSGGMRRRLILAQALLGDPKLLALDEPTAELDRETADRVAMLIADYAKSSTVLVTTHLTEHFDQFDATTLRVADQQVIAA